MALVGDVMLSHELWVSIMHALALEHTVDKLVEMTLDSAPESEATPTAPTPLVGTATIQDSDSDSEPVVDIDEYTGEDEDPVQYPFTCHMTVTRRFLATGCAATSGCGSTH